MKGFYVINKDIYYNGMLWIDYSNKPFTNVCKIIAIRKQILNSVFGKR